MKPFSPYLPIYFLLILFPLFIVPVVFSGALPAQDFFLPESKIRYPGGFDPNTVGQINGTAFSFSFPETGPVSFHVSFLNETYTVLLSPAAAWNEDLKEILKEGAQVRILGSKTLGADGRLYLIAQQVEIPHLGRTINFRSERGDPLWKSSEVGQTPKKGFSLHNLFDAIGSGNKGMGSSHEGERGGSSRGGGGGRK
jgi:hypothetical protein